MQTTDDLKPLKSYTGMCHAHQIPPCNIKLL